MSEETKNTAEQTEAETEHSKAEEAKEEKKEKKQKKNSELEKLKAELEKKEDLLLRTAAEFDNFKKRTERERAGVAEYARAGIVKKLLPIIDNIERSAAADRESPEYIKGIELIVKQFESLAADLQLEETAKQGDAFDPQLHEAVMHIEDDELPENVIAEVLQKGYKLGETVVRHAMVKVAN